MNKSVVPFNKEYFSQIVDFVKPLWSFSDWEDSFRKFYTEIILQNSFFENGLAFQIAENQELLAVTFFQKKFDKNNLNRWISENAGDFTAAQKQSINLCTEYLACMDSKVHSLMNENDIKLSLFVGCKKGYGSIIFEKLWNHLKNLNYKNLYLWTDCECNWQWYLKNGFILIEESIYEKFNDGTKKYKTYIFKKKLND